MAGLTMGAHAPASHDRAADSQHTLHLIPATTRTRRTHGVFTLGNELATVYSSRRESDGLGVSLSVGRGSLVVAAGMTTAQARGMARALEAAAAAADARTVRAGQAPAGAKGGAA